MPIFEQLKTIEEKTNNFFKRVKYKGEALEKKILDGKLKYVLEFIPGPGDYIWNRSMGESVDLSIGGAACATFVRGVPILASIVTGNPSWAIASEGFFDTLHETSTVLKYRKPKMIKENYVSLGKSEKAMF
jgi:hypothetical protein